MILLLMACTNKAPDPSEVPDSSLPPDSSAECAPAPLPVSTRYLPGFTGAEDFAFDGEGYLVSISMNGDLVAINQAGDLRVILPNATTYGAGTRLLPDGDLVFADVMTGSLVRVNPDSGVATTFLSGLEYPNGLDVDPEGFVFVAEQIAGRVRRVHPETGEATVVATGLYNPNGVTFSPDYNTLFVGSFGAGVVWAVDREGEAWSEPRVYASTPQAPGIPPDWCDTAAAGDECPLAGGYGLGSCTDSGSSDLYCASDLDEAACSGLESGEACTTHRFGEPLEQSCHSEGDTLFCPRTPADYTEACKRAELEDPCTVNGEDGMCYTSFEGVMACYIFSSFEASYQRDCADKAEGDACVVEDPLYPSMGACEDGALLGLSGLACIPAGLTSGDLGGLDGINVDACGDLYVTEFVQGKVWKFSDEGASAELVAQLNSSWIPNMHWGNGVGGWERDILYVMDRDQGGVFALEVGVEGHPDAYIPE